ncbi:MAG: hypothetical protein FWD31_01970 [Planctomycetaceae bacterium]|nr:hypothetical protein [Planctomycetaceae bacterium]
MPVLQYETRVSPDGIITVPPEFYGHKVVVSMNKRTDVNADQPLDDDRHPDPEVVRRFIESRDLLPAVEITDEEIEQLKHERRMRKML